MDSPETLRQPTTPARKPANTGRCQVCGRAGGVIYDPEKAPPNRLCYSCAAEYGMQDADDDLD